MYNHLSSPFFRPHCPLIFSLDILCVPFFLICYRVKTEQWSLRTALRRKNDGFAEESTNRADEIKQASYLFSSNLALKITWIEIKIDFLACEKETIECQMLFINV